jgi:NTE family protein
MRRAGEPAGSSSWLVLTDMSPKRALVLAGGGVAGIAWELGVLRGIQEVDPDLAAGLVAADVIVGTSAGSAVAGQITSGTALEDLYNAQLAETSSEIEVKFDIDSFTERLASAVGEATTPEEIRRRIGALALATPTVEESARRVAIAARLPVHAWPDQAVLLTAVDAETGELTIFTRESGVALVDAVAASCAVPGIWPPVTIGGRRYVDGGVRSAANADLASGCDKVLVITPTSAETPAPWDNLDQEIELLRPADVRAVHADAASLAAFGSNPLSPATRGPSARAGRGVGQARAAELARFWR